ncbi:uncharacterized protein LAJ45_03897 [Morchella importuna]|uniref:uncharacterized protein n=1 Tax=Morchella importuna TaxID=1174673 RepID=UPI001E8CECC0|nr:uncharacterized protein LAJ45_03897 [Morchella importuna]KAH8151904.1 hypothetical protein LAJ45_03897 [Morchella importuna]
MSRSQLKIATGRRSTSFSQRTTWSIRVLLTEVQDGIFVDLGWVEGRKRWFRQRLISGPIGDVSCLEATWKLLCGCRRRSVKRC